MKQSDSESDRESGDKESGEAASKAAGATAELEAKPERSSEKAKLRAAKQRKHQSCNNYPEVENYWGFKYNGKNEKKMKKCYHFLFSY